MLISMKVLFSFLLYNMVNSAVKSKLTWFVSGLQTSAWSVFSKKKKTEKQSSSKWNTVLTPRPGSPDDPGFPASPVSPCWMTVLPYWWQTSAIGWLTGWRLDQLPSIFLYLLSIASHGADTTWRSRSTLLIKHRRLCYWLIQHRQASRVKELNDIMTPTSAPLEPWGPLGPGGPGGPCQHKMNQVFNTTGLGLTQGHWIHV